MPTCLEKTTVEDVVRMVKGLAEEVSILKDREAVLEQLLIERSGRHLKEIEEYESSGDVSSRLAQDRQRFIHMTFGAPVMG